MVELALITLYFYGLSLSLSLFLSHSADRTALCVSCSSSSSSSSNSSLVVCLPWASRKQGERKYKPYLYRFLLVHMGGVRCRYMAIVAGIVVNASAGLRTYFTRRHVKLH